MQFLKNHKITLSIARFKLHYSRLNQLDLFTTAIQDLAPSGTIPVT